MLELLKWVGTEIVFTSVGLLLLILVPALWRYVGRKVLGYRLNNSIIVIGAFTIWLAIALLAGIDAIPSIALSLAAMVVSVIYFKVTEKIVVSPFLRRNHNMRQSQNGFPLETCGNDNLSGT